ncbi:hypothetical protein JMA_32350 [Jeotgalibacillus malaysiensis]|uniref:Uncharacterized protein n=1 Tax=Jeotgalibacillus malaysiensis TaxID=1508404 RepID=A0A0B5AUY3_9BACL|nr:hypothetical protein [Jeotgalibacillus malaysiensis]AJD92552.1 hypothetical protein JMA_32350 [Jeotgalibacillus malaysiensis]
MEKAGKWIQGFGGIIISVIAPFLEIYLDFNLQRLLQIVLLGSLVTLWGLILTKEEERSLLLIIFGCIGLACYIYLNELWLAIAMGISGLLLTGLNYLMSWTADRRESVEIHNE